MFDLFSAKYCLWLIAVECALYNMNSGDAISTHTHSNSGLRAFVAIVPLHSYLVPTDCKDIPVLYWDLCMCVGGEGVGDH